MSSEHFDIIIVGAGLAGVGAGVHLQQRLPHKSYLILEGRDAMGGTWDQFRYPGVRSDSDMFTLGYAFRPWAEERAIAEGASILRYINDTARDYGVDRRIRFKHRVTRAAWSSRDAQWTVETEHDGAVKRFTCAFLLMCAGYYDFAQGYQPDFAGMDRFKGEVIHPQHWPERLDYAGKRVVVIGSGATAVNIVPVMADKAAHVVMLQRSPTYMISLPLIDPFANYLRRVLPRQAASHISRFMRLVVSQSFFQLARAFPNAIRKRLLQRIEAQLGPEAVAAHFTPRYNPWRQRLCLTPNNELFAALRAGKASVVTDEIETFTETGLKLKSGAELPADIIVTATGLNLRMLGGAAISVDGRAVSPSALHTYKGAMFSDLPNLIAVFGYTNASWTLRAELICEYACRLIRYMDRRGFISATPRLNGPYENRPFVDFSSGYFQRAAAILPKQTTKAPWRLNQNYLRDIFDLRHGRINDGAIEFGAAEQ
jgi:cation diffusion facilitator CzcD-associated flavoprotein CzcO